MERLTEYTELGDAITSTKVRNNGHKRCVKQLAKYEDTKLTPEQVQELKERDTSKKVDNYHVLKDFNGGLISVNGNCPICGQLVYLN